MPDELQILLWNSCWRDGVLESHVAEQPDMVTCRQHFLHHVDGLFEYLHVAIVRQQLEQGLHKLFIDDKCLARVSKPVLGDREALQVDFGR